MVPPGASKTPPDLVVKTPAGAQATTLFQRSRGGGAVRKPSDYLTFSPQPLTGPLWPPPPFLTQRERGEAGRSDHGDVIRPCATCAQTAKLSRTGHISADMGPAVERQTPAAANVPRSRQLSCTKSSSRTVARVMAVKRLRCQSSSL